MKTRLFILAGFLIAVSSCNRPAPMDGIIRESMNFSMGQYTLMYNVMKGIPGRLPRTIDAAGSLVTAEPDWWTSGFFPGTLWYLYEYSGDVKFREYAEEMTARIEKEKDNRGTHDLGFMLYCSFGNGLRLTGNEAYKDILLTGAKSLITRYRPNIGCIQSWNSRRGWQCPVIIDNMMNLEFLMWAFRVSGDSTYYRICVNHSDTTMKNHFRPDYSSWHVVSYDTISGRVEKKQTAQGYSDASAWSRGQCWGLYGYVVMYRETGLQKYLDQATGIAEFLINHPRMPEDGIPYWDFDDPAIPDTERDASAGAIMASALIELSGMTAEPASSRYLNMAELQLRSLASPRYRAGKGENGNFILMHSTGSLPDDSEVNVPLTYADYYFIEALLRYRALKD